jgi:hypothetical protein
MRFPRLQTGRFVALFPVAGLAAGVAVTSAMACKVDHTSGPGSDVAPVDLNATLAPDAVVSGLVAMARQKGGLRVEARTMLWADGPGAASLQVRRPPVDAGASAPAEPARDEHTDVPEFPGHAVVTVTRLQIDQQGNFHLTEENDQDGAREAVLVDEVLSVRLKYGKMIRRKARAPEPDQFLIEAAGGPWAVWEAMRGFVTVTPGEVHRIRLSRGSDTGSETRAASSPTTGLRTWRASSAPETAEGEVTFRPLKTPRGTETVLVSARLKTRFTATERGVPITAAIDSEFRVTDVGSTPRVSMPEAEDLRVSQRTILEERELLKKAPPR